MYRKYNDLTALSASNVPMPQTRPRLSHKSEPVIIGGEEKHPILYSDLVNEKHIHCADN